MLEQQLSLDNEPLRVVQLTAENFMRLTAVDISPNPDQPVVRITGPNGAGKTSVINAMWAAFGGDRVAPEKAVRLGQTEAEIMLDLGRLVVRRKFTAKGSYLTVYPQGENGVLGPKLASPQAVLDELVGEFTLDPLQFARLPAKEQRDVLLTLCGLGSELDGIETQWQQFYDQRTEANRDVKRLEGALTAYAELPAEPPEAVDVSALMEQRRQVEQRREAHRTAEGQYKDADRALAIAKEDAERARAADAANRESIDNQIAAAKEQVRQIEARLDGLRAGLAKADEDANAAAQSRAETVEQAQRAVAEAKTAYEAADCPSTEGVDDQIAVAAERNNKIAVIYEQIGVRDRVAAELKQARGKANDCDCELKVIETQKTALVRGAELPVAGLGFEPDGVTFDDGSGPLPFAQINDAERLRISMAVATAGKPALRVLRVDDGEKLDEESFALVREEAAARGFQVWMTQVDSSGKVGVVIEDGAVAAVNAES